VSTRSGRTTGQSSPPDGGQRWDAALIVLAALLPGLGFIDIPIQAHDEGLLLVNSAAVADGAVPYRDFATTYGPIGYHVLDGAFAVAGASVHVERLVGVGYHVAIALGLWILLADLPRPARLTAALTSALLLATVPPVAVAWFGGLACVVLALVALRRSTGFIGPVVAGVLLGLAAGFRPEMAVFALAAAPLVASLGRLAGLAVGFALGLAPTLAAVAAAPKEFVEIPVARLAIDATGDLTRTSLLVWLVALLCLTGVVLGLVRWRQIRDSGLRALVILAALALPVFVQRPDWVHAVFVACVALPTAVAVVGDEWGRRTPRREGSRQHRIGRLAGLSAGSVAFGLVAALVVLGLQWPRAHVENRGRTVPVDEASSTDVRAVIRTVEDLAPAGSRVMVGPLRMAEPALPPTWLGWLLPAHDVSPYFGEWVPGFTEQAQDRLVADLREARVLVLADQRGQGSVLFPHIPAGADDADRYVARTFCRKVLIGAFWVLTRTEDAAPGVDGLPAPCRPVK
jgi:hypothetical protein